MKGSSTKKIILLLFSLLMLVYLTAGYVNKQTPIELKINLPKEMGETDFSRDPEAQVKGSSYTLKGSPFLYYGFAYFSARDLSDIYGIDISYNQQDRAVVLTSERKMMVIMPRGNLYDTSGKIF